MAADLSGIFFTGWVFNFIGIAGGFGIDGIPIEVNKGEEKGIHIEKILIGATAFLIPSKLVVDLFAKR